MNDCKKIIIVGGVAGGMSAAARARRLSENAQITVFEKGGYVSFANCGLPYYLGKEIAEENELILQTPESLKKRFNIDVYINSEVTDIDSENKTVSAINLQNGQKVVHKYDELVLAVGAKPLRPNLPGIDLPGIFVLRSLEDMQTIEHWIKTQSPKTVAIAGAGFIGLEMAEQMVRRGLQVTIIDGLDHVLAPIDKEMAEVVHAELINHHVTLVLNSRIQEFKEAYKIQTSNGEPKSCWVIAGSNAPIHADMVIMGLGVKPDVELAKKAGIKIGGLGGIKVDEHLRTNIPNIWAIGDVIEVIQPVSGSQALIALGGPANRQGRAVADNIFGHPSKYKGSIGTAILRVFDLTIATVGLNEDKLQAEKIPYRTVRIHPSQHASYYPGAKRIDLKLLFGKENGKLLGAQAIGKEGVDKRIDVLATAIKAGMDVREIADLELAYAPPFGSAKDPINLAGMAACNILDGLIEQSEWQEIERDDACILDVRSKQERNLGFVPNSVHIPLPELRNRLTELSANKPIYVYCQSGQRSYFAVRQLIQRGFNAKNLSGGFLTWTVCKRNAASLLPRSTGEDAPLPVR